MALPKSFEEFLARKKQVKRRLMQFERQRPREDFTWEESVMMQMFGRGEHIWGTEMQPVKIYNDLQPRQRGDTSTSNLFGFGDEPHETGDLFFRSRRRFI